jgi:hypothetical protein
MQTSFMHPPFGFALFYLRSVAPINPYRDKVTGQMIAPVTTGQIYWGAVPFVCIQILMVALVIAMPAMVTAGLGKHEKIDIDKVKIDMPEASDYKPQDQNLNELFKLPPEITKDSQKSDAGNSKNTSDVEDPAEALKRQIEKETQKK